MTRQQEALAAGRISKLAELAAGGDENLPLHVYCHLCLGHPEISRSLLHTQVAYITDALTSVVSLARMFEESAAIHDLPKPKTGGAQSPERPDQIYDELREVPSNMLLADLQQLERSAKQNPEDAELCFRLGEIFGFRRGDPRKGRLFMEAAIRADPSRALYWGYTAELIYKHFSVHEAVDYYNAAVFLDPDNPRWHLYRSIVLMLIFDLSMAEPEGLPLDAREEILREATVAIEKAELLGDNYEILKACRLNLENVESAMPLGRLPRVFEIFFGSPSGQS